LITWFDETAAALIVWHTVTRILDPRLKFDLLKYSPDSWIGALLRKWPVDADYPVSSSSSSASPQLSTIHAKIAAEFDPCNSRTPVTTERARCTLCSFIRCLCLSLSL